MVFGGADDPQVASVLEEAWAPEYTYIGVIVDEKTIQDLQVGPSQIWTYKSLTSIRPVAGAHPR